MGQDNLFRFCLIMSIMCLISMIGSTWFFMQSYHTVDTAVNLDMVNADSDTLYFDCDYSNNICKNTDEWYAYGIRGMKVFFNVMWVSSLLFGLFGISAFALTL